MVPSRQGDREYRSVLVRQTFREDGKVKHRTLANLSKLPEPAVDAVRAVLQGKSLGTLDEQLQILHSLPHGHVQAILGCIHGIGLDSLIASRRCRERDLVLAMIASRLLRPRSKLATVRSWQETTLAQTLGVEDADEDDLYAALDWLGRRQGAIEEGLAKKHLVEGGLVLYDLTSSVIEGRTCPLAKLGYSRDGKPGHRQVEFGLLTDQEGRPVAVDVFAGNVGDPSTVAGQATKLKERFGIERVVLVGDRGMLTSARIEALKELGGLDWISALRSEQIKALVHGGDLQLGLFDKRNLLEMESERFPGERLVVCKNPSLAQERGRKREALLESTESALSKVVKAVDSGRLRGKDKIALRVGRVVGRFKMAKHLRLSIEDTHFSFERDPDSIAAEAALDGFYVVRSNLEPERMSAAQLVRSYKRLSVVERAFRGLKSVDLQVRPIYHRLEERVRAHIFLCMLAYYVRWHLEQALAPLLFRDEHKPRSEDPVAPAQRSARAEHKARTHRGPDGELVHSFPTLLGELGKLAKARVRLLHGEVTFDKLTELTALQQKAFALLGINPSL